MRSNLPALLLLLLLPQLLAAGCGSETSFRIQLDLPSLAEVDPFEPGARVETVRFLIRGNDETDEVILDRVPPVSEVSVEGLMGTEVSVEVFGYDALGNLRAYGRRPSAEVEEVVQVTFRRTLAYVIHRPDSDLREPDSVVYAIDMATRTRVARIGLGAGIRAASIRPWGGQAMLIGYRRGLELGVLILRTGDHSVETIDLGFVPDLALAASEGSTALAVDAANSVVFSLETGEVVRRGQPIGGNPVDGVIADSGRRAVVVMDLAPNVVDFDLRNGREQTLSLNGAGGVGLDRARNQAYVAGDSGPVAAVDLASGNATAFTNGFATPVGLATYSAFMDGLVAVEALPGAVPKARSFSTFSQSEVGGVLDSFRNVTGISSDGAGRRVMIVAAGTSTLTAGISVLDTRFNAAPEGTNTLYPLDPEDVDAFGQGRRWQPAGLAIPFGD